LRWTSPLKRLCLLPTATRPAYPFYNSCMLLFPTHEDWWFSPPIRNSGFPSVKFGPGIENHHKGLILLRTRLGSLSRNALGTMLDPQWNHCFSICWTAQSKTARSLYWTRCRLEWSEVGEQPHPCHTEKEWNEHSSSTPTSCLLLHPQPIPVQSTAVCTWGGGRAHKYATAALVSHSGLRTEAA